MYCKSLVQAWLKICHSVCLIVSLSIYLIKIIIFLNLNEISHLISLRYVEISSKATSLILGQLAITIVFNLGQFFTTYLIQLSFIYKTQVNDCILKSSLTHASYYTMSYSESIFTFGIPMWITLEKLQLTLQGTKVCDIQKPEYDF